MFYLFIINIFNRKFLIINILKQKKNKHTSSNQNIITKKKKKTFMNKLI